MNAGLMGRRPKFAGPTVRRIGRFGWRAAFATVMISLLVACGGGGGDSSSSGTAVVDEIVGPPTTSAVLSNTSAEVQQSTQAAVGSADAAANRAYSLSGLSALVGGSVVPQSVVGDGRKQILAAEQARPLAVQTLNCSALFDPPCSGGITMDTNIADTATVAHPGDYADVQFASSAGSLFGLNVTLNGRMRIDFLAEFDSNASRLNGLDLKLKLGAFGGSVNGVSFGPVSDSARVQYDEAKGGLRITTGGASYSGLHGVTVNSAGYGIAGGTVRVAYWSDSGKYIDIVLMNWNVVGGRPAVGSWARAVDFAQNTITSVVTSSSQSTVVYDVVVSAAGPGYYTVTATYPAGGGAPTYAAVAKP